MSSNEMPRMVHGGPNHHELTRLGVDYSQVLDFSVSTNPYGPSPTMVETIQRAVIDRYPDPTAAQARVAIAEWLDVSERGIVIGNGAADLLWTVARALLQPSEPVVIVEPTFSEFRAACVALRAHVIEWRARAEDAFAIDLDAVSDTVRAAGAKVVYLCSPNTPTGTSVNIHALSRWAERHGDTTVVLDQSFLSLSEDHTDREVSLPGNVVLVRSLTKDHALPGVRVGYLVSTPRRAALVERQRPAWSASAMAQAAAICAPTLDDFVSESREKILADRRGLTEQLAALGLTTMPSRASYLLAQVTDAPVLRAALVMRHSVLVRDCASFGLPGFIRIAARPEADRARLIEALRQEL